MNELASNVYAYHTGRTIGRYKLLELVGSGGTAEVYRSVHPDLEREVAIKILYPTYTNDPGFVKRFRQEAQTVAALMHPHIVQVYDFAMTEDGLYYIVMQYIDGISLDRFLGDRETPLPLDRAYAIFCQIAVALQFAHDCGAIHRDLKPANILLDGRDHVYLTDFGFAKLVGVDLQTRSSLTLGTPVFMAPEQIENSTVTAVTDVYALGAILYQMLTSRLPYEDSNVLSLILRKIEEPPPSPQLYNPAIPDALARLILKAMAIEPRARFASAAAMQTAFAQIMKGDMVKDGLTAVPAPLPTSPPTRRRWLALLPLLLLLACALALFIRIQSPLAVNGLSEQPPTTGILATTNTPTPTITPSLTLSPTHTVTATPTTPPTHTASATPTASVTTTPIRTPRPTQTATTTSTATTTTTPTPRPTQTLTPTATTTMIPTDTAVPPTAVPSTNPPPPNPPTEPPPPATEPPPEEPTRTPPPPPTRTPPPQP
ncbi:MAG: serine/threonine protein kinase [Anaerolineae bacterium]|nr:serine/threonine protein kinase [Anaerolineae bacterium]